MKQQQQRQGDVFFCPVKEVPKDAEQRTGPRRGILALGEATGHHHSVVELEAAEVYDLGEQMFLHVGAEGVSIAHQEHGELQLAEGLYEVRIQTEEGPDEVLRRVAD